MPTAASATAIDIHGTSRNAPEEQLDAAMEELKEAAMFTGTYRIRVIRHGPQSYTPFFRTKFPSASPVSLSTDQAPFPGQL